jgi:ABC-type antimicrobial peptide transport system permease subunit
VITSVTVMEPLVLYMPIAQQYPIASRDLLVRAAADPDAARGEVLSAIRQLDPSVTPAPMYTMQERLGRQMSAQRFGATVLGTLGFIAILLTLLGTYVLADSMATMRMREMGIRAALGATRRQLGSIVINQTARLIVMGIAAGVTLAWLGSNTIRAFLFQVQPLDPVTLGIVAGLILLLALAVSLRAAVRAARVDLASVLKAE